MGGLGTAGWHGRKTIILRTARQGGAPPVQAANRAAGAQLSACYRGVRNGWWGDSRVSAWTELLRTFGSLLDLVGSRLTGVGLDL